MHKDHLSHETRSDAVPAYSLVKSTANGICLPALRCWHWFVVYTVADWRIKERDVVHESSLGNVSLDLLTSPYAYGSHMVRVEQRTTCVCNMFHRAVDDVVRCCQLLSQFNMVTQ